MAGQTGQPIAEFAQVFRAMIVQIHRVQTERRIQLGIALHQLPDPLSIALINPQHHHSPHPECAAFGHQRLAVSVKIRKIQMGVGVDQFHGSVLTNPLLERPPDGLHARLVIGLFDCGQGQREGLVGNQLMLLGHGVDRQRQEVQQLRVTERAEA